MGRKPKYIKETKIKVIKDGLSLPEFPKEILNNFSKIAEHWREKIFYRYL